MIRGFFSELGPHLLAEGLVCLIRLVCALVRQIRRKKRRKRARRRSR